MQPSNNVLMSRKKSTEARTCNFGSAMAGSGPVMPVA